MLSLQKNNMAFVILESCLKSEFQCQISKKCIPIRERCNSFWNCGEGENDKSDEENCGN